MINEIAIWPIDIIEFLSRVPLGSNTIQNARNAIELTQSARRRVVQYEVSFHVKEASLKLSTSEQPNECSHINRHLWSYNL